MDFKKAISTLELSENFSEEDLKKQFRKLAAKYHPDINKSPDAEQKSKEISEAHNFLKDEKNWKNLNHSGFNPFQGSEGFTINFGGPFSRNGFRGFNIQDAFQHFSNNYYSIPTQNIQISFKDSVLGCNVQTSVEWMEECEDCPKDNSECSNCHGSKRSKRGGKWTLKLSPGTLNNSVIQLDRQINNKIYKFSFRILVSPSSKFSLHGPNIVSVENISLLHALKGRKLEVETLTGKTEIDIPIGIKNNTTVIVKGGGIPGAGDHHIVINVDYPNDTSKLIKFLEEG